MNLKKKGEQLYDGMYDALRSYSAKRRRITEFKKKTARNVLTDMQISEVKSFWAPYAIPNMVFHRYFTERTGVFHPNYIPQDIWVGYIDPYFNDIRGSKYFENKCYYNALFHDIPQPETVLKRVNGIWLTGDDTPVSRAKALEILAKETSDVFVKEAQTSSGGSGVTCAEAPHVHPEDTLKISENYETDVIIQRGIKQHQELSLLNAASVNTIRLYSVLGKDGYVTVYSAVLRMGSGTSRIDNYSAGGVTCGITEMGTLRRYAYNKHGQRMERHPTSGIVFEGLSIPSYDLVLALVKKAHPMVPHYRSVAWDVTVDKTGTPVLIEANLCRGGIDSLQLNNGPLYGNDTTKILDEVFGKIK